MLAKDVLKLRGADSPPFVPSYPALLSGTNLGFEAGSLTGWTQDSGGPASAVDNAANPSNWPGPHSGSWYMFAAAAAATSVYSQTLSIPSGYNTDIDAGLLAIDLQAWHGNVAPGSPDTGSLLLECIDSGTTVLASHTTAQVLQDSFGWAFRSAKIAVPSGTRKIRLGCTNVRNSGTNLDVWWDDFAPYLTDNLALWANALSTGNRTATITVTATNITAGASTPDKLINGSQSNEYWWTGATGNGTGWLTFDMGSSKILDAIRWYQSNATAHGVWRIEGSPDNSAWTQIGSDFTLVQDSINNGFFYFPNSTGYRYYRMRHMSGSRSSSPFLREIEFRIT